MLQYYYKDNATQLLRVALSSYSVPHNGPQRFAIQGISRYAERKNKVLDFHYPQIIHDMFNGFFKDI